MDDMKQKVEDQLGVKLLTVMYLGRRQPTCAATRRS